MPIYEFDCLNCENTYIDLVKQDTKEAECPKCGSIGKKRVSKSSLGGFDKYGRSK